MSRRKYAIIFILALAALLCMVGASTWIITTPQSFGPEWDKGKTPVWVKRYADFNYESNGITLGDNLTKQIEFCDENGDPIDNTDNKVATISISDINVTNDDDDLQITDKKITVGSTYQVDNISVQFANDNYQLIGSYTTDSNKKDTQSYIEGSGRSYILNGLLLKYKTAYQGTPTTSEKTYYTIEDALSTLSGTISVEAGETSFTALSDTFTGYTASGRTVEPNKTLLIPRSANDNGAKNVINDGSKVAYATLTLPSGNMTVGGTLTVNASRSSSGSATAVIQTHGLFQVKKDAHVEFTSGAHWYCLGYSYGDGTVNVAGGATVYETFSMPGWKGGSISSGIRENVFPLNQYAVNGIICRTTFNTGCLYYVQAFLTATGAGDLHPEVPFITSGTSSFLELQSGSIDKWINESKQSTGTTAAEKSKDFPGKIHFEVNGSLTFHNISIDVGASASTSGKQIPLPGNFAITLNSGTATIPSDVKLKLLPGATLNVKKDASLIVDGEAYAYGDRNVTMDKVTDNVWQDGNNGVQYPATSVAGCYRKAPTLGYTATTPATVTVAGKLTVNGSAKVGGYFDGEPDGQLTLNGSISGSFMEDYSTHGEMHAWDALTGKGGSYFTSTFSTKGPILSADNTVSAGDFTNGVWIFSDGAWRQPSASNSIKFNVKYNAGDGTFAANGENQWTEEQTVFVEDVAKGAVINYALVPGETPTRAFYEVAYWGYKAADGTLQQLDDQHTLTVKNGETIELFANWEAIKYPVTVVVVPAGMEVTDVLATLVGSDAQLAKKVTDLTWSIDDQVVLKTYTEIMADLLNNYNSSNNSNFELDGVVNLVTDFSNLTREKIEELTAETLLKADLSTDFGIILVCKANQVLTFTVEYDTADAESKYPGANFDQGNLSELAGQQHTGIVRFKDLLPEVPDFNRYDSETDKEYYFDGWYVNGAKVDPDATVTDAHLTQEGTGHKLTLVAKWAKKAVIKVSLTDNFGQETYLWSSHNGQITCTITVKGAQIYNDNTENQTLLAKEFYLCGDQLNDWQIEITISGCNKPLVGSNANGRHTYSATKNTLELGKEYVVSGRLTNGGNKLPGEWSTTDTTLNE